MNPDETEALIGRKNSDRHRNQSHNNTTKKQQNAHQLDNRDHNRNAKNESVQAFGYLAHVAAPAEQNKGRGGLGP